MRIPVIRGVIDRRILVNYRVDPSILGRLLPPPFRPQLIHGAGLVGICLIRLKSVRPSLVPTCFGISSENAAHRVAVEWDVDGVAYEGVYVWRRDTNSRVNSIAGGRLFPGIHHHAQFTVIESQQRFEVAMQSDDHQTSVSVQARVADQLPASSVFSSLDEASAFFRKGSLGYSATTDPGRFQGLELRCSTWKVEPMEVENVRSSFFDDPQLFSKGSIEFDCALLMRGIDHQWLGLGDLCCEPPMPQKSQTTRLVFAAIDG